MKASGGGGGGDRRELEDSFRFQGEPTTPAAASLMELRRRRRRWTTPGKGKYNSGRERERTNSAASCALLRLPFCRPFAGRPPAAGRFASRPFARSPVRSSNCVCECAASGWPEAMAFVASPSTPERAGGDANERTGEPDGTSTPAGFSRWRSAHKHRHTHTHRPMSANGSRFVLFSFSIGSPEQSRRLKSATAARGQLADLAEASNILNKPCAATLPLARPTYLTWSTSKPPPPPPPPSPLPGYSKSEIKIRMTINNDTQCASSNQARLAN